MAAVAVEEVKSDDRRRKGSGLRRPKKKKKQQKREEDFCREDGSKSRKKASSGPHLPNALRRELDLHKVRGSSDKEEETGSEGGDRDAYEYEEDVPEEEAGWGRRFDPVENNEYDLPSDFEDDDISSEDEDGDGHGDKHKRMLEGITGIPALAFSGKKKKEHVLMDPVEVGGSNLPINIHDLLDPLHGKSGYDKLRKSVQQQEKKPMILHPPLPKAEREKLERKVTFEHARKDITKWEPLVKRNREAPTIYFANDMNLGSSTIGSIASTFEPRTEFEKKMAALMTDPAIVEAHEEDGKRLLELNKISVEDVKDRRDQLAKMRTLLFRHDMKQKRIRKIKSKAYHRMLKKDKAKATTDDMLMDPEAIQEEARKQEFKRAEERLRLKHKNKSKWAQRILKRGLNAQDEGTRAAIAEQLRQHEQLTRKMNSTRDSSSEDSSSDDGDEEDLSQDPAKTLVKAREKTIKVIEEEDEIAKSGVLSLPFMVRGLKKKKEAVEAEAQCALHDYEMSLGKLDGMGGEGSPKSGASGGRKVFGIPKIPSKEPAKRKKREYDIGSDSEAELDFRENDDASWDNPEQQQGQQTDGGTLIQRSDKVEDLTSKSLDIDRQDLGSKMTYDVAVFASGGWRKVPSENPIHEPSKADVTTADLSLQIQKIKESDPGNDVESEDEMLDGSPSSDERSEYELPSQSDLIRRAFAGDDVELEFERDKMETLNEEVPEPEKPLLLPGWGQWTDVQKKKGPSAWMTKEHEDAKRKREEALKKRKDAHLKHVIISEKPDKKAERLHTKSLPFPFTSKEVFEQSLRMPIGPDFNPATSFKALIKPSVVKEAGMKIEPIKYEDVDPYQKSEEADRTGKSKPKRGKRPKVKGTLAKKGSK